MEIQERRRAADRRAAEQERRAAFQQEAALRQEYEVKLKELEASWLPLVEEVVKLKYAHVGIKRVQTIDFFTDSITTEEQRGIEDAITGGSRRRRARRRACSPLAGR